MGSVISTVLGGSGPAGGGGGGSSETAHVQVFHSSAEWQLHLNSVKDNHQLMVIDFAASWCDPCKAIEPHVHTMAAKYTDVSFAKIDVNELPDVAEEFRVQAMPTFVLAKGGKEVDRLVGASKNKLEKKIIKYRAAS